MRSIKFGAFSASGRTLMKTWAADAILMVDLQSNLPKYVHRTRRIDKFLDQDKYFLCASKGMGKTLLLAYKRYLLENGISQSGFPHGLKGVRFVPSPKPYLDVMSDVRSLNRERQDTYASVENAKRVWGLALRLSALSYVEPQEFEKGALPDNLAKALRQGHGVAPTEVFQELVGLNVSRMHGLHDTSQFEIEHRFRDIQSGVAMFIDRVDQALMSVSKDTWIALQAGLIEAAWDAMSTNRHIRIFATIRQEAFSSYSSPTKANVRTGVTEVSYSESELGELLDRLTENYEDKPKFSDFIGVQTIDNRVADITEDAYSYLYRHTIGRPRDLVQIAASLSNETSISEATYRDVVNREAAPLAEQLFEEMAVFLSALRTPEDRARLFALIPRNVLTRSEIEAISRKFNGIDGTVTYSASEVEHPFCELHATGLLGILRDGRHTTDAPVQSFKLPTDQMPHAFGDLTQSDFYLLHPALEDTIRRANGRYEILRFTPIGQGYPWPRHQNALVEAQCALQRVINGAAPDRQNRLRDSLRPKVVEVLRGAHQRVDGKGVKHQSFRATHGKAWDDLARILAGSSEYDPLREWMEEVVRVCQQT
jgi:hypothetical protein